MRFTDLDGHAEALTSAAYPASSLVGQNAAPTGADRTVTVAEDTAHTFQASEFGFADTDGDAFASVKITVLPDAGKGTLALDGNAVTAAQVIAASELGTLTFAPPANANGPGYASFTFKVSDGTSESAAPYVMTIDVTAVNDPATGAPTISGTARVGQTLTADASGIADDADGLPAPSTFSYQWLRVDGGSATEIQGAESKTYRLVTADAGAKFRVTVRFTDLDGHAEALTSAAYPASSLVGQNAAPTGADRTVTVAEDTAHTFQASEFGFADTDGDALASVKITVLPDAGKGTLVLDGNAVTAAQVIAASELGTLTFASPANANGEGYASFTFKVSDGVSESAAPYVMTIDVTAVNDPCDGCSDDLGDGAGWSDADGGRERDRGRRGRAAGALDVQLPVAAGGRWKRDGDPGGGVEDLPSGYGGCGREVQGDGALHGP